MTLAWRSSLKTLESRMSIATHLNLTSGNERGRLIVNYVQICSKHYTSVIKKRQSKTKKPIEPISNICKLWMTMKSWEGHWIFMPSLRLWLGLRHMCQVVCAPWSGDGLPRVCLLADIGCIQRSQGFWRSKEARNGKAPDQLQTKS